MTTTTPPTAQALRQAMVDDLTARGFLTSTRWKDAFAAVPREAFLTSFTVPSPDGDHRHHDLTDPRHAQDALAAVYTDTSLLTQHDAHGTATSSSTAPSLMALMLEALGAQPGMTLMEVGGGTGYNAGILAHVLGDHAVTTVDIDPRLTARAQAALHTAGYRPTVITADGSGGHPDRAPYDRIITTCGLTRIPACWLTQVRPGGVILANIGFGLARLTVDSDGTAAGPFLDYAAFMSLRRTDLPATTARDVREQAAGPAETRTLPLPDGLDAREITFLRTVMMPGVHQVIECHPGSPEYVLYDPESGSWARARAQQNGTADVRESGPRNLWDELTQIADGWNEAGRPAITDYTLTVTADGQHELHLATQPRRWPL